LNISLISFAVLYADKIKNCIDGIGFLVSCCNKFPYGFTITGKLNRNDFGIGQETVPTLASFTGLKSNVEFIINQ